jgi:hypothetical protein
MAHKLPSSSQMSISLLGYELLEKVVSLIIGQLGELTTWILYNANWSSCISPALLFLSETDPAVPVASLQGQIGLIITMSPVQADLQVIELQYKQ